MNVERAGEQVLLEVKGLQKLFPIRKGFLQRTVGYVRAIAAGSLTRGRQAVVMRRAPSTAPLRSPSASISTRSPVCGAWIMRPWPM